MFDGDCCDCCAGGIAMIGSSSVLSSSPTSHGIGAISPSGRSAAVPSAVTSPSTVGVVATGAVGGGGVGGGGVMSSSMFATSPVCWVVRFAELPGVTVVVGVSAIAGSVAGEEEGSNRLPRR